MSSLSKFSNRTTHSQGQRLFWQRAGEDGAPFRGAQPPLMRDEEYEARATRVKDFQNGWFDSKNQESNDLYREIMDRVANGWYQLVAIERFVNGTNSHYVEWIEYFMEDMTRTPYNHGIMEMQNGPSNFPGHS